VLVGPRKTISEGSPF